MSRSHPPLQQHLLTRSDLARLGVPAGDILAWLARGAIEQVGTLAGDGGEDPVFTAAPELRAELSTRLASIGKSAVVMSPLRVRSFLLRALMNRAASAEPTSAHVEPRPEPMTPSEALAEHLATTDLAQVLHEAATELEADVEHVLRIAEEEARLEASVGATAADAALAPAESGNDELADQEPKATEPSAALAEFDEEDDGDEACFDVDDLASALGEWDEDPATTAVDPPADDDDDTPAAGGERMASADHEPCAVDPEQQPAASTAAVADLAESGTDANDQIATEAPGQDEAGEATTPTPTHAVDAQEPLDEEPAARSAPSMANSSPAPESEAAVPVANQELPAATPAQEALAEPEPVAPIRGDATAAMPAVEATSEAAPGITAAPCVDDDASTDEPEVATASTAAPVLEEPTMSAEPMVTEHEDHSAPGTAASGATTEPKHAFEPGMQADDPPPTFDADEIAAALSVLDLDVGPAKGKAATSGDEATPSGATAVSPKVEAAVADTTTAHPTNDEAAPAAIAVDTADDETPAGAPERPASAVAANAAAVREAEAVEADIAPEAAEPAAAEATVSHPSSPPASSPAAATTTNDGHAPTSDDGSPLLAASMQRVEAFLGELKAALVEMAGRTTAAPPAPTVQIPPPAPVDLAPLVGAIEGGLERSAATSAATASALSGLAEKLDGIGQRLERSAIATESVAQHAKAPRSDAEPARFLVARSSPVPLALLAVAAMVTAWSVLFWFKTGSPRLALGTLIGANLVGCVMLAPGRFR